MSAIISKEDILRESANVHSEFSSFCSNISNEQFFRQPVEKWSIAQNVTHLVTSANMTRLVYRLPKFVVRIYTGKPNRPSRTYDELVAKYKLKLSTGGRASGRFVAKPVAANQGKEKVLGSFDRSMDRLITTIQKKWDDPQLDQWLAPHPLLGKITLRELGFFTIYHSLHHLQIIHERLKD